MSVCSSNASADSEKALLAGYDGVRKLNGSTDLEIRRPSTLRQFYYPFLWGTIFGIFSTLLVAALRNRVVVPAGYWKELEFEPAKKDIGSRASYKSVRYTAGLVLDEQRVLQRTYGDVDYVGDPSPEVDAAWRDIVGGVNIFVTAEEKEQMSGPDGDLYFDPTTGLYMAELTATHDLHCLNYIREAFHLDYYVEKKNDLSPEHVGHCIDALRQSIMCSADMSLIPMRFSAIRGAMMPDFESLHTCRDYDVLKKWSEGRDATTESRWRENARRLNPDGPMKHRKPEGPLR